MRYPQHVVHVNKPLVCSLFLHALCRSYSCTAMANTAGAKLEKHMDGVRMLLESLKDPPHFPQWHHSHFQNILGLIEGSRLQFKAAARLVHKVKGMPFFESFMQ